MIGWDILPRPDDYVPKLIDIARRHPEDEAALDALAFSVWLLKGDEAYHLTRERADVLELLTSNHIHDADLSRVFYLLEGTNWAESIEFLRTVLTSSRDANVRAHACFSLGNFFAQRAATARMVRSDGFRRPQPPQSFQPSQLPSDLLQQYTELQQYFDELELLLEQTSAEDCVAEAERFYDRVTHDYPDVILRPATYARLRDPEKPNIAGWEPRRLGQLAEQARYALHHLSVGQLAPEIKGEDIDGRGFKLSDYRGKVVVLAFSGNWCGACIAMYPQHRDMVERLKDKPFVLLHVNSDSSREEVKRSMDDGKITWRSWFDGGSSHGPIATQWQMTGWPVIYVIDEVGVIRYMNLRGDKLDAAVDRLIGLNFEQGR